MRRGGYILGEGADTCVFKPSVQCQPGTESKRVPPGKYVSRIVPSSSGEVVIQRNTKKAVDYLTASTNKSPVAKTYLGGRPLSAYFNFAVATCKPQFKPEDFTDSDGNEMECSNEIRSNKDPLSMVNMITPEQGKDLINLPVTPELIVEIERLFHAVAYLASEEVVHFDAHFGNIAKMDDHLVMHDWGRGVMGQLGFFIALRGYFSRKQERDEWLKGYYPPNTEPAKFLNKHEKFMEERSERERFIRAYDILSMAGSLAKFIKNEEVVQTNLVGPIHELLETDASPDEISEKLHEIIEKAFAAMKPSSGGVRKTRRVYRRKSRTKRTKTRKS